MQVAHKVVTVLGVQGHERAAHDDEFDLVYAVAQALELVHPVPGLQVRVVPRSDRPHRRGLGSDKPRVSSKRQSKARASLEPTS